MAIVEEDVDPVGVAVEEPKYRDRFARSTCVIEQGAEKMSGKQIRIPFALYRISYPYHCRDHRSGP